MMSAAAGSDGRCTSFPVFDRPQRRRDLGGVQVRSGRRRTFCVCTASKAVVAKTHGNEVRLWLAAEEPQGSTLPDWPMQ